MKKKAIVLGGSKGIGAAVSKMLLKENYEVISTNSSILDTSNLNSVRKFTKKHNSTDFLLLNTGGPEQISDISKISEKKWVKYFNQLFLGFYIILQNIKINKNGYVFLISSHKIKDHDAELIISSSLRLGFLNVFNAFGKKYIKNNITFLNIAPGPIKTKRLKNLNVNLKLISKKVPLGRIGLPGDISNLILSIIKYRIKYLNCKTLFVDGGISKDIF